MAADKERRRAEIEQFVIMDPTHQEHFLTGLLYFLTQWKNIQRFVSFSRLITIHIKANADHVTLLLFCSVALSEKVTPEGFLLDEGHKWIPVIKFLFQFCSYSSLTGASEKVVRQTLLILLIEHSYFPHQIGNFVVAESRLTFLFVQ